MLTLIIQNRKRAGWLLVRSCAERVSTEESARKHRFPVPATALAALVFLLIVGSASGTLEWRLPQEYEALLFGKAAVATVEVEKKPAPVPEVSVAPPAPKPPPAPPMMNAAKPKILGRMVVEPGETVYGMLYRVYGDYDEEQLKAFLRANRRLENINLIRRGDVVTLPAIAVRTNPLPPDQFWVAVAAKRSLGEAYESLRRYPDLEGGIRLFPYWNPQEGVIFALLVRKGFRDEKAAGEFIRRMPAESATGARVVDGWPEGTEFYAR